MARLNLRDVPGFPDTRWKVIPPSPNTLCEYCGFHGQLTTIQHDDWGYPICVCDVCRRTLTADDRPAIWRPHGSGMAARIGERNVVTFHDGDQWGLTVNDVTGIYRWESEDVAKQYAELVFSRK